MEWVPMHTHYHRRYLFINFLKICYQNKHRSISKPNGCPATPIRQSSKLIKSYQKIENRCFSDANFQPKTTQKFDPPAL